MEKSTNNFDTKPKKKFEFSKWLKEKGLFYIIFVFVVLTGFTLRFYQLETIPPGLQYDEAYNGLEGLEAWQKNDFKIFFPENNGREGLYINLVGIAEGILGVSNFSIRSISAIIGSFTILAFYFLLRKIGFDRYVSLMGMFLISFSFWHLGFSRTVYRAIFVPLLLILSSYFLFQGIDSAKKNAQTKKGLLYFVFSGLFLGLGFHTYIAARVAPLIFVIVLSFFFLIKSKDFLKTYWVSILLFCLSAFLAALPLFIYFQQNPSDLTNRSNSISVFNAPNMSPGKAFGASFFAHLFSFFFFGDPNQRHNFNNQPLLPPAWSILFAIGFFLSTRIIVKTIWGKIKKKKKDFPHLSSAAILAQAIFWTMLIPGILTIEGIPHSLRIIGTIPAVFIFMLFPFEYLRNIFIKIKSSPERLKLKPLRFKILKISTAGIIFTTIASGILQSATYFELWSKDKETWESFEKELFDLGKLAKEIPLKEKNFIIISPEIYISPDRKKTSLKTTHFSGYPKIDLFEFYHPQEGLEKINCDNSLLIFQKKDPPLLKQFQKKCPELETEERSPQNGNYSFWIMY